MSVLGAFDSGKDVTVEFSLDLLSVDALTVTVTDSKGNTLLADEPVSYVDGEFIVNVTVPASVNQLSEGKDRDLRRVKLTATKGSTSVTYDSVYVLMATFEVEVFAQSFIGLDDAVLAAIDLPNGDAVMSMDKMTLRRSLMEATDKIKQLPMSIRRVFGIDYDDYDRPQNMLNVREVSWGQEGQYKMDIIDWTKLTAQNYADFPETFKKALEKAVVNEVAESTQKSEVAAAREEGIVSESIGETTLAYRQGKSATSIVAKSTFRSLVKYLETRIVVRRS